MRNSFTALWVAMMAILLSPLGRAEAQMDFSLDDADSAPAEGEGGGEAAGGEGGMDFSLDDAESEGGEESSGEDSGLDFGSGGDDLFGEGAGIQVEEEEREAAPRTTESVEEIYAVQRTYALRLNRVELAPSAAFTINDPYVSHPAASVALNYWWTNVLAVGVNFLWYQWGSVTNRESDLNFFVRRASRLAIPITDWQMGAYLNFTYVPFYGKFAVFNNFIFQWDSYIVGGVGLMRTRPVPVVDPEIRQFDFGNRVAFNLGIGIRVFLSRYLGVFLEFRDYAYLERFEALDVAANAADRTNPDTWFDDGSTFTNNVTTQVGFTLFFPFTFEYRLPK